MTAYPNTFRTDTPIGSPNLADAAIGDLIDLGAALNSQVVEWDDNDDVPDVMAAIVPRGYQLLTAVAPEEVRRGRSAPDRVTGHVTVTDIRSFLHYWTKYGTADAEVYGDVKRSTVTGILNAPSVPEGEPDAMIVPAWGDHRVTLALEHSAAWNAWVGVNDRMLSQVQFAEHIEDRSPDMVNPDAATMLEVAQTIHATTGVQFQSGSRLHDGQRVFQYIEQTAGTAGQRGDLAIPTQLELAVQVWRGVDIAVPITARFRYRPSAQGLSVGIVLDRLEDVLDAAWADVLMQITGGINADVLAGHAPVYDG